jgi:hypothetical protein
MRDMAASLAEQGAETFLKVDKPAFFDAIVAGALSVVATQIRALPLEYKADEFDELRATQAAAVVLSLCKGQRANYAEVLKVLYLADCRGWMEAGVLTTRSRRSSVERNERMVPHAWDRFMRTEGEDLVLLADPSDTELCDYDVETLTELWFFRHPPQESR